jgi:beta-N-acetylhexosaminidase
MSAKHFGRLMLDLCGTELTENERSLLSNSQVGGVILFARNIQSKHQVIALVEDIRRCSSRLIIAVDQEGGRVQRFKEGFTRIPPMQILGDQIQTQAQAGLDLAENAGWLMASEVIACGLDISFAPVLDVDREYSSIIGDRAFSDNPELVILAAKAFVSGMNQAGHVGYR